MLIKSPPSIASSEITSETVYSKRHDYLKRREFIQTSSLMLAGVGAGALLGSSALAAANALPSLSYSKPNDPGYRAKDALTPYEDIKRYNNFYEFGTDKTDPARYAQGLTTDPWSITIEGEVAKPGTYQLEDVLSWVDLEERIYRLRCVEAWSMVVPWVGFSFADVLKQVEPTSKAKYVEFETLYRPEEMRAQRSATGIIPFPYREGLRIDEVTNPLAILAVGIYGKVMPKQNGAPIRLVVPWKYGFKSIKSIVKIRLLEKQPVTTWERLAPREYGFYANVNPAVDHPRWSQKTERRLPSSFFQPNRIPTQLFNGYADQVAHLYKGMDLRKFY